MNTPHFDLGPDDPESHCIVCGKSVANGGGMVRMKAGERIVCLCCPLCDKFYRKDPGFYHALRDCRQANRATGWTGTIPG